MTSPQAGSALCERLGVGEALAGLVPPRADFLAINRWSGTSAHAASTKVHLALGIRTSVVLLIAKKKTSEKKTQPPPRLAKQNTSFLKKNVFHALVDFSS